MSIISRITHSSAVLIVIGSLAACSTPPPAPTDGAVASGTDLSTVDTAPGLDGQEMDSANRVQIGGVNQDGIASVEISDGQLATGSELNPEQLQQMMADNEPVIYFDYDQYSLSDEALRKVQFFSEIVLQNPSLKVVLEGHTDERGTPEYNLALGERRSKAVQDAMLALGLAVDRIEANSYGEEYPVAFEKTEAAWALNRRVEIIIR